ncbi:MAG: hypothetical protein ACK40X_05960 [Armatimonadota bacterium]
MRWPICLGLICLLFVAGCERVRRGEVEAVDLQPTGPPTKKVKPQIVKPSQPEAPTQEQPAAPETTASETPATQPAKPATAPQPATVQPSTTQPAPTPEVAQPTTVATAEPTPMSFADEARSVRASADTLHNQFDRLPVGEIKSRLLLLNQAVSELEVRSPALVLWRTALRLDITSKAPFPDVAIARAWIVRARTILSEQKVGLTALASSEEALKKGDWKGAVSALRDAATKLKAIEQAEALTQARVSLLNALDALEKQKNSVAKAEVSEAVKALDKLISVLP